MTASHAGTPQSEPSTEIQLYLDRPLDDLLAELTLYREQAEGGAYRSPGDAWQQLVPALRQRVCIEWNWCARRQDARFEEPLTLATLLIDILAPDAMRWKVPTALIVVILVKKGLDVFCQCPPMGERKA